MQELDVLVLGAGWVANFLIPLLRDRRLTFAATTRDGRRVAGEDTLKWSFDPSEAAEKVPDSDNQFSKLPLAKTLLVTFPLGGSGQSKSIVDGYRASHQRSHEVQFVQLGSTGIWQIPHDSNWITRHSSYDASGQRTIAEDELLGLGGCVLNLAGLWGGERNPKNWINRVAKTKDDVKQKKSLHLVHGLDVARAIIAVHSRWEKAKGQRWMLTDGFVYDWWSLMAKWADVQETSKEIDQEPSKTATWVFELMQESQVAGLPRSMQDLGRCYDSREFWHTFDIVPLKAGI